MSIQPHGPLVLPFPHTKRRDVPRLFLLTFNQSKLKSANPAKRLEYQQSQTLWGTLYPNGAVSLERDYMNYWSTLTEMCDHLAAIGKYDIEWYGEMEDEVQD